MWIIKDIKLRQVVNKFFTDKEIEKEFLLGKKNRITLAKKIPNEYDIIFIIYKDQFVCEYDPNSWNPYPAVLPPPPVSNNPWLAQREDGSILIANFSRMGGDIAWFSTDSSINYALDDIVAFRKLPEPYNA